MCPRGYCGAGERRDEGRGGGPEEESGRVDGARGERRTKVEEEVQLAARERVEVAERVEAAERGEKPTVPTSGQGAYSGTSQPDLSRSNLTQSRPPKTDHIDEHFGTWSSKFLAYISVACIS